MRSINFVLSLMVLFLVAFTLQAAEKGMRIAVVNMQDILDKTEEGKKTRTSLDKEARDREEVFKAKQKEFKKLQEDLEKQRLILNADALEKKNRELQDKAEDIRKYIVDSKSEMDSKSAKVSGDMINKIKGVVTKVSADKGFDLVVEAGSVIHFTKQFDITDDVITAYNKTYK